MVWSKLKTRVLSAVVLVAILLVVTLAPPRIFTLAVSLVSLIVLYELMNTFSQTKKCSLIIANYIFACAYMLPLSYFIKISMAQYFIFVTILFIITLFAISVFNNKKVGFNDVLISLFSVIYAVFFLMPISAMRAVDETGLALVFLAFIGAWLPDTFAYFIGCFFGKRKLIPEISPNKTVAGSVGAFIGAIVFYLLYGWLLSALGMSVNFLNLLILALVCGAVSQIGDLAASMIKRTYGVKDFSNLIPGHGGLLDRIDSLLFVAPTVYYFIEFLPII